MRGRGHTTARDRAAARFSALGEHGALWLGIGLLGTCVDARQRRAWLRATATVAGVYGANTAIKLLVRRPRPAIPGLPPLASTPSKLSFPSAHTATACAGTALYSALGVPRAALLALAGVTGISRLYLGLHYPSDVLAGAVLGAGIGRASAVKGRR